MSLVVPHSHDHEVLCMIIVLVIWETTYPGKAWPKMGNTKGCTYVTTMDFDSNNSSSFLWNWDMMWSFWSRDPLPTPLERLIPWHNWDINFITLNIQTCQSVRNTLMGCWGTQQSKEIIKGVTYLTMSAAYCKHTVRGEVLESKHHEPLDSYNKSFPHIFTSTHKTPYI